MLRELHVSGLGVIEDVELELHPGLNVLTGETGTGKTMVTVALALALGRRASASLVRAGVDAARVQARFDAVAPATAGAWDDADELVLARTIAADGRSTARVGTELAPVSGLAALAPSLVEIHGQHDGIALRSHGAQLAFLDRFAGARHLASVGSLAEAYDVLRVARERVEELRARERDRERELDLLRYQIREIESVAPRAGELEDLLAEEARLTHAERLLEHATSAERTLDVEDGAAAAASSAAADLRAIADRDAGAEPLADSAATLAAAAVELARDVRAYREALELDPARLDAVGERLAAVKGLLRRYGETESEVITYLEQARVRHDELARAEEVRSAAETAVAEAEAGVERLAAVVGAGRRSAAPRLARAVEAELRDLGMPEAVVVVELLELAEVAATGAERAEFRFAGAAGQPPSSLAKVASGGELSRAMLACRSVLADLDAVPTIVFDEVDAGIGGMAGAAVGRRLARLAATRQVLVVTHLPQIASFGDRHFRVEKDRGTATVEVLDEGGRVRELTRMLSGMPQSEAAATHAEELLAEAGRVKADG